MSYSLISKLTSIPILYTHQISVYKIDYTISSPNIYKFKKFLSMKSEEYNKETKKFQNITLKMMLL